MIRLASRRIQFTHFNGEIRYVVNRSSYIPKTPNTKPITHIVGNAIITETTKTNAYPIQIAFVQLNPTQLNYLSISPFTSPSLSTPNSSTTSSSPSILNSVLTSTSGANLYDPFSTKFSTDFCSKSLPKCCS
jgi:hypothetical protein